MAAHDTENDSVTRKIRAYVETYGCQMNVSDGELMQGILAKRGYEIASSPEDADVVLVNTCAIREHAEQRVLGRVAELNRLKLDRPDLVIGVTGCMAQRMGEELLERAPYVDLVMGPDAYRGLPEALGRLRPEAPGGGAMEGPAEADPGSAAARGEDDGSADLLNSVGRQNGTEEPAHSRSGNGDVHHFAPYRAQAGADHRADTVSSSPSASPDLSTRGASLPVLQKKQPDDSANPGRGDRRKVGSSAGEVRDDGRVSMLGFEPHENYEGLEAHRASRVAAWVPVQRGCNYRCTYCIVPYVRGPEKNRNPEHILDEVRAIAADGTADITLLGQTVNSYRYDDWDFARLLRAVAHVDGIRRVRFTSPHPNDFTPALIAAMAEEPTVCNQLHLPVQSGHNRTLKRMLRRYTVEEYRAKIAEVREAIPDIALSTDIIVAFPGESESEFEATLDLVREVRFDDAFMYKYSPRDGTPATRMPEEDFLPGDEAQARLERLIGVQRNIQAEINRAEVGDTVEVLVERDAKSDGDVLGRTERNKVVAFPGRAERLTGRFAHVRLTGTTGATFTGERIPATGEADTESAAGKFEGVA